MAACCLQVCRSPQSFSRLHSTQQNTLAHPPTSRGVYRFYYKDIPDILLYFQTSKTVSFSNLSFTCPSLLALQGRIDYSSQPYVQAASMEPRYFNKRTALERSPAPQSKSLFFRLPPEIRIIIYKLAFPSLGARMYIDRRIISSDFGDTHPPSWKETQVLRRRPLWPTDLREQEKQRRRRG